MRKSLGRAHFEIAELRRYGRASARALYSQANISGRTILVDVPDHFIINHEDQVGPQRAHRKLVDVSQLSVDGGSAAKEIVQYVW